MQRILGGVLEKKIQQPDGAGAKNIGRSFGFNKIIFLDRLEQRRFGEESLTTKPNGPGELGT